MSKFFSVFLFCTIAPAVLLAKDAVILKSGKKIEGTVVEAGDTVKLVGKYGVITYQKSEVKIVRGETIAIHEVKEARELEAFAPITTESVELTTKSGRKIIGTIYQKDKELFLIDQDSTVRIEPSILVKYEKMGQNKIKGDIIMGENCIVILKSGRVFSGVMEEFEESYFVSSPVGTIKVNKEDIATIRQTGTILNLKEKREQLVQETKKTETKLPSPHNPSANVHDLFNQEASQQEASSLADNSEAAPSVDTADKVKTVEDKELTAEEIQSINQRAEKAIKESKEKSQIIKTVYETY